MQLRLAHHATGGLPRLQVCVGAGNSASLHACSCVPAPCQAGAQLPALQGRHPSGRQESGEGHTWIARYAPAMACLPHALPECLHHDAQSGCLSPQNVLLTAHGAVRLGDVGFSRMKEKTFISQGEPPLCGQRSSNAPLCSLKRSCFSAPFDLQPAPTCTLPA